VGLTGGSGEAVGPGSEIVGVTATELLVSGDGEHTKDSEVVARFVVVAVGVAGTCVTYELSH